MNRFSSRLLSVIPALVITLFFSAGVSAQTTATTGIIRGKVREMGGKALDGVQITATRVDKKGVEATESPNRAASQGARMAMSKDRHTTTTNQKGEFSFADLVAGNYILSFEKAGFLTITSWQMELRMGETMEIRKPVELPRDKSVDTSLIRGAVFNEDGFTLPNAILHIERIAGGKKYKKETSSTEGGSFVFRVPSEKGIYRITAKLDGFEEASIDVEVEMTEVRHVSVQLRKKP